MTGESFEYEIKKDVRNNSIVREVDEERHREMWRSVGVGAFLVVAFLFFAWLVPPRTQPTWVANAKSKVVLQSTGDWLMSMLPEDPENTILRRLRRPKQDEGEPPDAPPGQKSSREAPTRTVGYDQDDRTGMRSLIQGQTARR